jgi:hypothetical protein
MTGKRNENVEKHGMRDRQAHLALGFVLTFIEN